MLSIGVVESLKGQNAVVNLTRSTACGDCGACQMGKENLERQVEALNLVNAKIGDFVTMEMEDGKVLKAAFMVYIIPLIILVTCIFGTISILQLFQITKNAELYGFLVGLVGMAISFLIIKRRDNKLAETGDMMITIVKINEEESSTCTIKI